MNKTQFLFNLENGDVGTFSSEDEAFHFSGALASEKRAQWAISTDQQLWLPLGDWYRLKTTQSSFNPEPFFMDRRMYPRYGLHLQVNLLSACRSFAAYTTDVSEGGLRLERPIPISVQKEHCTIQIISPKNRELIQLLGKVTTSGQDAHSMKFESLTNGELIPHLMKWVAQTRVARKKTA